MTDRFIPAKNHSAWRTDGVRIFHRGFVLASVLPPVDEPPRARNEVAYMMAAAPELLAACEAVVRWLDSGENTGTFRRADADAVRSAVSMAKGKIFSD